MNKSVCFTGHRTIAEDKETLTARLYALLERFVTEQKVTDFYTGGAVGWDTLAALTVLKLRESYPQVKLHLVLPCTFEEQSAKWNEAQRAEYQHILGLADSVEQVSDHYYNGCMKVRNARLVELASDYCISYWNPKNYRSGTGQTVRMAQKKGLTVINLLENIENSPPDGLTETEKRSIIKVSYESEVTKMPRAKKTETTPAQTEAVTEIVKETSVPVAEKPAKRGRKKKVETAAVEVKADAVTETVQETVAEKPAKRGRKKKSETAPAEVKADVVKETVAEAPAKAEKPAKKTATRKTAAKTTTKTAATTTRATTPVETVKVQFGGDEYDFAEIKKAVEADYKSKFKGKVKTIEFYIKPEDKAVYYVINGDFSDKIEL